MSIDYKETVKRMCERFNLSTSVLEKVIKATSEGNCNFTRFCPTLYFKHTKKKFTFEEEIGMATRWGVTGILGLHARQMGYEKDLAGLWQPIININYACKFLSKLVAKFGEEQGIGIFLYEWEKKDGGASKDSKSG